MLLEQIEADLITALKEKKEVVLISLRNLKAAFKNAELEKRQPLTDQEAQNVIAKKVKQHKDSIAEFEKGQRADLVEKEKNEMAVLEKYLPKQMEEGEVRSLVKTAIRELNAKPADFGRVMKES